jgi:ATP-dependent Clp protease ATP-binding subunit ClpC
LKFAPDNPDRLTDRAKRVFRAAEAIAMARNACDIAPYDLLLAIAECDRGVGRFMLEELSIDLVELKGESSQKNEESGNTWAALGFSPETLHVFAWAKEEARLLGHNYIGTEHLVLGLLRDEQSKAGTFLRDRSASSERARDTLREILGRCTGS